MKCFSSLSPTLLNIFKFMFLHFSFFSRYHITHVKWWIWSGDVFCFIFFFIILFFLPVSPTFHFLGKAKVFRILTLRFLLSLTLAVCVGDSHRGAEQTWWRPRCGSPSPCSCPGAPLWGGFLLRGPARPPRTRALRAPSAAGCLLRSAFHLAPVSAAPVALWLLSCVAEVPPAHSRRASSLA